MAKPVAERLAAKAHPIPFSGCLTWTGDVDKDGYGYIRVDGKKKFTHRVAYSLAKGEPKNFVCHTCDTPGCINPDHLYDGDNSQNMQDRSARGRARMAVGEKHGCSKYTEQQIKQMRDMRDAGASLSQIAAAFGKKDTGYISLIVRRKLWKHI